MLHGHLLVEIRIPRWFPVRSYSSPKRRGYADMREALVEATTSALIAAGKGTSTTVAV
jgi:hypothetical protein